MPEECNTIKISFIAFYITFLELTIFIIHHYNLETIKHCCFKYFVCTVIND